MANPIAAPNRPRRVAARRDAEGTPPVETEDIHPRNYDAHRTYTPTLVVTASDGEEVLRRRYRLPPGQCRSESDILPRGPCVVRVRLDDGPDAHATCRVDDGPGATALVELGNGVVTVSVGLP